MAWKEESLDMFSKSKSNWGEYTLSLSYSMPEHFHFLWHHWFTHWVCWESSTSVVLTTAHHIGTLNSHNLPPESLLKYIDSAAKTLLYQHISPHLFSYVLTDWESAICTAFPEICGKSHHDCQPPAIFCVARLPTGETQPGSTPLEKPGRQTPGTALSQAVGVQRCLNKKQPSHACEKQSL